LSEYFNDRALLVFVGVIGPFISIAMVLAYFPQVLFPSGPRPLEVFRRLIRNAQPGRRIEQTSPGIVSPGIVRIDETAPVERPYAVYRRRSHLLSQAETRFYHVLLEAVGTNYTVMSKVRLADVLDTVPGLRGADWSAAIARIQSKHVDFLVVDVASTEIACVVELDDRSHQQAKRMARDEFVDGALEGCAVPVFRVPARASYDPATVRAGLHTSISRGVMLRRRMKTP
jgi:hypothetical protein